MIKVKNPYTGKSIQNISLHSKAEVDNKIDAAQSALKENISTAFERSQILHDIAQRIEKSKEEFISCIIAESAKPRIYAKGEVERAIQTFTIAAEEATRPPQELMDLGRSAKSANKIGEIRYFPCGVIFGISPFNFPLNLVAHKVAPAIATGSPIILKPSSKTPLTAELLMQIISQTSLNKAMFQLVHCSRDMGNEIIKDSRISVLSFTGSPDVGWNMKALAGKKKVVLELGGNAAAIVCNDAQIEDAVNKLIIGAWAYSGQVCIHTQRIYVHQSQYEKFVKSFKEKTEALTIGSPEMMETNFSSMIDEKNTNRVKTWIDEAIDSGAKCIVNTKEENGILFPCILTNTKKGMKVRDEEVFGPVICLESYSNFHEVIKEVNDSRWGLQAAIFTDSISKLDYAFQHLEVGGLIHNEATTFRVDNMPYGGIKDSGFGREGIKFAMHDYLEAKILVKDK